MSLSPTESGKELIRVARLVQDATGIRTGVEMSGAIAVAIADDTTVYSWTGDAGGEGEPFDLSWIVDDEGTVTRRVVLDVTEANTDQEIADAIVKGLRDNGAAA